MKRSRKCFAMLLCSAVIAGLCLSGCSSSPAEKSPSSTTSDTESLSSTTSVTDQSSDIASVSENQSENSEAPASSEEESEVQSHPMVARHPQVRSQNETPSVTYSLKPVVMKDYYELSVFVPDNFPLAFKHDTFYLVLSPLLSVFLFQSVHSLKNSTYCLFRREYSM